MTEAAAFTQYLRDNAETLEMYTKAIAKVHGPHHPEIIEVRKVYEDMQGKSAQGTGDFSEAFAQLSKLTNGYVAPSDTCETVRASYAMLEEAQRLYLSTKHANISKNF